RRTNAAPPQAVDHVVAEQAADEVRPLGANQGLGGVVPDDHVEQVQIDFRRDRAVLWHFLRPGRWRANEQRRHQGHHHDNGTFHASSPFIGVDRASTLSAAASSDKSSYWDSRLLLR